MEFGLIGHGKKVEHTGSRNFIRFGAGKDAGTTRTGSGGVREDRTAVLQSPRMLRGTQ